MFTTDGADLLFDGEIIFRAPSGIEIMEPFADKALVFYKTGAIPDLPENREDINRNILMLCKDGNIFWRIENPAMDKDNTYASLYNLDGMWKAYLYNGYHGDLDLETGKVSNLSFVR